MAYHIKGGPPVGLRVPLGPYFATGQQIYGQRLYGGLGNARGLGYLYPLLRAAAWAATGIATWDYVTDDEIEDQWLDSDTFNSVGAQVNAQFELINQYLSDCPGAWNQESAGFRAEWGAWSEWWGEEGDRFLDADLPQVHRLRDFAKAVNDWAIRIGNALRTHCPDQFDGYPYKDLVDLQIDPGSGTIDDQQKAKLEQAKKQAQIAKTRQQQQQAQTERWSKILSGVGWVLVGGITLATVAFGYRIYKDVRK